MEYLVGIIVVLLGGVFYFKKKADTAGAQAKLAETKGQDIEKEQAQQLLQQMINEMDSGIEKMKKQKAKKNKYRTLKERADEAKDRYKK